MTTERDVLHAILEVCGSTQPDQLRKAQLMTMRQRVMDLAAAGLSEPGRLPTILPKREPKKDEAVEIVLAYEGEDRFLLDLRRSIHTYGGLTAGQRAAVLRAPTDMEWQELRELGYERKGIKYAFQAIELIREGRRRVAAEIRAASD